MSRTELLVVDHQKVATDFTQPLQRAIDRPLRTALELARSRPAAIAAIAAIGAFLITVSAAASAFFGGDLPLEGARIAFEAMAIVVPSGIVFATYARVRPSPAAMFASASIALLIAGVVSLSVLPLLGFIALATQNSRALDVIFQLFIPSLSVGIVARHLRQFLRATDPSPKAGFISFWMMTLLLLLYAVRVEPVLAQLGIWRIFR